MPVRDKQINEMIGTTMKLNQLATSLELPMVSCLYRMILMELSNQATDQPATGGATSGRLDVSAH